MPEMGPEDVPREFVDAAVHAVGGQLRYHSIEADVRLTLATVLPKFEEQLRKQLDAAGKLTAMAERLGKPGEEWRFDDGAGWFTITLKRLSDEDVQRLRETHGFPVEHRIVGEWRAVGQEPDR